MTDRSSHHNPYASSSSRRASLAWSQPEAKSGPRPGADFKGLPVRPGSPREAACSSASQSSSLAMGPDHEGEQATPLHERQAEALTGLGGGKRKAQEQLTSPDDSKKARAAGQALPSASSPVPDGLEDCHVWLDEAIRSKDLKAIREAADRVHTQLGRTANDAMARDRFLSFARARPLDSVEACHALLAVVNRSNDRDLIEKVGREVALRLGGTAIDAGVRDRLFEACLRTIRPYDWNGTAFFMAGMVSACLPDKFTQQRAREWLGHFREATNRRVPRGHDEPRAAWFETAGGKQALAHMAVACGLTAHETVHYLIREHDHDFTRRGYCHFFCWVVETVTHAFTIYSRKLEAYWPDVLSAWAQELAPDPGWGVLIDEEFGCLGADSAVPLTREWALDQIRTPWAVDRNIVDLLLKLEEFEAEDDTEDDTLEGDPKACEALLARLVSDPVRARQIPGVLLAVLRSCDFDEDTTAWREVLWSFVQAAAPHATPGQWVAIGMENRWFSQGDADHVVGEGFVPVVEGEYRLEGVAAANEPGASSPLSLRQVRNWLHRGELYADPALGHVTLLSHVELTEAEKVQLMCLNRDVHSCDRRSAAHWLGLALTLGFALDLRVKLMAHLFQNPRHAVDASHFDTARCHVMGQMVKQGAVDKGVLQRLRESKASETSLESAQAQALTRQLELAESMLVLHRAWQKRQGFGRLLQQRRPGVASVEPHRKALLAYQRFLQEEIGQLADCLLPANVFDSVLEGFLRPALAQVDRLLALPPDGKAAPRGLDDDAPDVGEPKAAESRSSSSSSSLSSSSS